MCLEARRYDVRCRCQRGDKIQCDVCCLNAVLRVSLLLAGYAVDEIVIPHDDEQDHEHCNEAKQDHVADRRNLDLEAGVPHHCPHQRKHDDEKNDDVCEVAENICCDPNLEVLE